MSLIVALDPSGNFTEGNGTTGICIWDTDKDGRSYVDDIHAGHFKSAEEYWQSHVNLLESYLHITKGLGLEVVMEGYRLYGHKSDTQVNSTLETPQLIGVIRYWCYANNVPLKIQYAVEVKNRWSDSVLEKKGIIEIVNKRRKLISSGQWLNNHKTDALRHALHYQRYKKQ